MGKKIVKIVKASSAVHAQKKAQVGKSIDPRHKKIVLAIGGAITLVAVVALVLLLIPMNVSGKTFKFESFTAEWTEGATTEQKQETVDFFNAFTAVEGMNATIDNFFECFNDAYVANILADNDKYFATFNEDGTATYLGESYTWIQAGAQIGLYSGGVKVKTLEVVGNSIVEKLITTEAINTETVFVLE